MELSNNQLVALLLVTGLLVVAAAFLTITGGQPPAQAPQRGDPGVLVVVPDITREGGVSDRHGPVVVKLDRNQAATSAKISCETFLAERHFAEEQISFEAVPDESCTLQLAGSKRPYAPVFRGDVLTCSVAGEDTRCSGGIATKNLAQLIVTADVGATVSVDGKGHGALPQTIQVQAGRHNVELKLEDGRKVTRPLFVGPGEKVSAFFPVNRQAPSGPPGKVPVDGTAPPAEGTAAPADGTAAPAVDTTAQAAPAPAPAAAPVPAPAP